MTYGAGKATVTFIIPWGDNGLDPSILGRYGYLRSESVSGVNVSEFDLFLKRESRKRV